MRSNTPVGYRVTRYDYINRQDYYSTAIGYLSTIPDEIKNSTSQDELKNQQTNITTS